MVNVVARDNCSGRLLTAACREKSFNNHLGHIFILIEKKRGRRKEEKRKKGLFWGKMEVISTHGKGSERGKRSQTQREQQERERERSWRQACLGLVQELSQKSVAGGGWYNHNTVFDTKLGEERETNIPMTRLGFEEMVVLAYHGDCHPTDGSG